jgi:hypothetical protein
MRKKLIVMSLAGAIIMCAAVAAFACGDKLVLSGAFARYRLVNAGSHPASILAYARQDSALSQVLHDLQSQSAVKQVGHKFVAVDNSAQLDVALKTGKYDLVLADAADAEGLVQEVRSAPSMPAVLPVVYKSTKAEATAVEKRFHCVLKAPASPSNYIAAIDDAMALKARSH